MKQKNLILSLLIFTTTLFAQVSDVEAYNVSLCTEADCDAISWTFGGQTHSETLNCSNILTFVGVSAGTYDTVATGCGVTWSDTVRISANTQITLCESGRKLGCCSTGCGTKYGTGGEEYLCEDCGGCPLASSLDDDAELIALLRAFRDEKLRTSVTGLGLTALYDDNREELRHILAEAPELQSELTDLVAENAESIRECMDGNAPHIDERTMERAQRLLNGIATMAEAPLRDDIDRVKSGLDDRSLIREICK
jgi:hypothetical protein